MPNGGKQTLCRHNRPAQMITAYETENYLRQFCRCYKFGTGESAEACDYWEWDPNWEAPHEEWPRCPRHDAYSAKYISHTDLNPDRPFYRCPKGRYTAERCGFFVWEDELDLPLSFFEAVEKHTGKPKAPFRDSTPSPGPTTPPRTPQDKEVSWSSSSKTLVNSLASNYLSVSQETPSKSKGLPRYLRPDDEQSASESDSGDDTPNVKKQLFTDELESLKERIEALGRAIAHERKKRLELEQGFQELKAV